MRQCRSKFELPLPCSTFPVASVSSPPPNLPFLFLYSPHDRRTALLHTALFFFFFNDTATTEIYTLSLHDALPIFPRILSGEEWQHIESGIVQRITAINLLLDDIYHDQHILRDGIVPPELILTNRNHRPLMRGIDLPHKTYVNICGTDIVRDEHGAFLVLQDNARTPSRVSYVVEHRHMMLRAFPDLLDEIGLRPTENYGAKLISALYEVPPAGIA